MAWGSNYSGQLGDGTNTDHYKPAAVPGLSGVAALAAGDGHTLALGANGGVKSWGLNANGELGNGNNTGPETCYGQSCSQSPIVVGGLSAGTAVDAGFHHSLALVGPSRALKISLAGRGRGAVGGTEILCPLSCSHRYPQGAHENLLARAPVQPHLAASLRNRCLVPSR